MIPFFAKKMNLINLEHITKQYDERVLLDDVSWSLNEGEKVGIIGINGTGKTTLLKIIAGIEEADKGTITKMNGLVISYLPQHPTWPSGTNVLQAVLCGHTEDEYLSLEVQAKRMLTTLSVTDFSEDVEHLSGGQRKRLALVQTLLSGADVLLLDEPTNHLDSDMAEWLETYLKDYRGAMVMITHDRYFLDSVTNRIVELDKGKLYSYKSGYLGYLEMKEERERIEESTEQKRQNLLRIELAWMRRGARARSTKQKAHIARFEALDSIQAPTKQAELMMSSASSRLGRTVIEIEKLNKAFGDRVLVKDYDYFFTKNERIGYVGPNGCGKSTLMKMLSGLESPDSGVITIGQTVKIGYYGQEIQNVDNQSLAYMNPNKRVIDYIRDTAEYVNTKEGQVSASVMLDRFLFPPEKQYALIGKLSGGEKRRLNLLRVLMEAPNVLILDEPTNDLDIATLQILEDYVDHFEGVVLIVSHDRYLLDRLVNRIVEFAGNGELKQYEGNYTDYYQKKHENDDLSATQSIRKTNEPQPEKVNKNNWKENSKAEKKLRFSYSEQREYDTIETDLEQLSEKMDLIDLEISKNASNYYKLQELEAEKTKLNDQYEAKLERWMYLSDLAERIAEQEKNK